LNNYFTSVFTPHSLESLTVTHDSPFPDIPTVSVDANGVLKLLNELDVSKTNGLDKIPAHLLKLCNIELAPMLTFIFQVSIQQSRVPSDWKKANIVPIFKKGGRALCHNYRPVSLTCNLLQAIRTYFVFTHIHSVINGK